MIRSSSHPKSKYHRKNTTGQRILAYLLMAIVGITILGTVLAFIVDPHRLTRRHEATAPTLLPSRVPDPIPEALMNQETFTLLGTLRSGTCDNPSIPLVVEPWFYYDSTDISFYQELQQKSRRIRTIITDFFPRYTLEELNRMGEQNIKKQLAEDINSILILGSIDKLYFNDFTIFD